jgi:hypothetical protein
MVDRCRPLATRSLADGDGAPIGIRPDSRRAAGDLGREVVRALVARGHAVCAAVRL